MCPLANFLTDLWHRMTGRSPEPAAEAEDNPEKGAFARELLTLRVRTVYSTSPRTSHSERDNRQRLFQLSRLYADYLDTVQGSPTVRDFYGGISTFMELETQATQLLITDRARARAGVPATLTPAQADLLGRIQRTSQRIVQDIFHDRRRACARELEESGEVAAHEQAAAERELVQKPAGRQGGKVPGVNRSAMKTTVEVPAKAGPDEVDDHDDVGPMAFGGGTRERVDEPQTVPYEVERGMTMADLLSQLEAAPPPPEDDDDDDDDDDGPKSFRSFGEDNALARTPSSADQGDRLANMRRWAKDYFSDNFHWDNDLLSDGLTTVSGVEAHLLPPDLAESRRYPDLLLSRSLQGELEQALELGTDIIALETSMSLSGDITTVISPLMPEAQRDLYLSLHKDGMSNALSYWTSIIQALQAFLNGLFDTAMGKGDR